MVLPDVVSSELDRVFRAKSRFCAVSVVRHTGSGRD